MKTRLIIFVGIISFLITSSAFAVSKAGQISVSLDGAYAYFTPKRKIQNTGVGYGVVGYNFTDHWGIEGLAGFFTSYSRRTATYDAEVNGKIFAVDGVYHFCALYCDRIEPFILAGVGMIGLNKTGPNANDEGNINAGVGTYIYANTAVALRLEARDFYTIVGGKNDFMIGGGVSFFFN